MFPMNELELKYHLKDQERQMLKWEADARQEQKALAAAVGALGRRLRSWLAAGPKAGRAGEEV